MAGKRGHQRVSKPRSPKPVRRSMRLQATDQATDQAKEEGLAGQDDQAQEQANMIQNLLSPPPSNEQVSSQKLPAELGLTKQSRKRKRKQTGEDSAREEPASKQARTLEATTAAYRPPSPLDPPCCKPAEASSICPDPVRHWVYTLRWPERASMTDRDVSQNNKRLRTVSDDITFREGKPQDYSESEKAPKGPPTFRDGKFQSYTQDRKVGKVPQQYTKAYQAHVLDYGLNMDLIKGGQHVSTTSKTLCTDLFEHDWPQGADAPSIFPPERYPEVLNFCQNRNEALVNRDITPLLIPPLYSLFLDGKHNHLAHVIDEVNCPWNQVCFISGPIPQPDLAIGLFYSLFTMDEQMKLKCFSSGNENLASFTDDMYFPFLMLEVKCGNEGLDYADRQNMHSCSVAVKAQLKLEQAADKHRVEQVFNSLLGETIVYSISHDQSNARLYGHYAMLEQEKLVYYRYKIAQFQDITDVNGLLRVRNFALNVLKDYQPKLVKRLQAALEVLPDPRKLLSESEIDMSVGFPAESPSGDRAADSVSMPPPPTPSQASRGTRQTRRSQMDQLMQQLEQQREESKKELEQQRQDSKEQIDRLMQQLEKQRQQMEQQRKEDLEQQRKQTMEMMEMMMRTQPKSVN